MKNTIRIALFGLLFSALFLSSCSFGFVPSWKEKEKAVFSLQFATLDSIARVADGSRAIVQGDGFLYIRTLGGPKGDKGPLYGPYKVSAGSAFETNDIPAGTYSKGIAVLYSAVALGSLESLLKLPEDHIMSELEATAFVDALSGVASSGVSEPKTIKAGQKNSLSLTLVPIVNAASVIDMDYVQTYTVTPATTGGSVKKFIMLDNVTSGLPAGDSIKDLVCVASGAGTLSRLTLYDENGALVPGLTINTETRTYTVPYTSGSTFYLYIESSGGDLNLAFNALLISGGSTGGNVRVSISGATAEAGKTVYFNIIPTLGTTTYLAAGSFNIEIDGTGSGPALSMLTGAPITLAPGTYYVQAYIDINGNSITGFDGKDPGEPTYISTGMAVTAAQTTIPLARASFTVFSPYVGYVYYVSNFGGGDGSPSSPMTFDVAYNAIVASISNTDGKMNWIVLTENITTTNIGMYSLFASKPVSITSNGVTSYSITLGNTISGGPFIDVPLDATLNLMDATIRGALGIYATGGLVRIESTGVFNMLPGAVLSDNQYPLATTANGMGVNILLGGTFNMTGGVISNCSTAKGDGGGVYVSGTGSNFQMVDGLISICAANDGGLGGGGVCIDTGLFVMSGGTISGCTTNKSGGGVHNGSGNFIMIGGIITGNAANSSWGGGICVDGTSMSLSGTAQIVANSASLYGGGLYLGTGLTSFTLSGTPSITGNETTTIGTDAGPGVYILSSSAAGLAARDAFLDAPTCVTGNFYNQPPKTLSTNNMIYN